MVTRPDRRRGLVAPVASLAMLAFVSCSSSPADPPTAAADAPSSTTTTRSDAAAATSTPATSTPATSTPATGAPTVTATATTIDDGAREVRGDGFTARIPTTWAVYTLTRDGTVSPDAGAPPLAVDQVALVTAAALQGGSLHAIGPAPDAAHASTLTVSVIGADTVATGAEISDALRARAAADGVSSLDVESILVDGHAAAQATFVQQDGAGRVQLVTTVYVPGPDHSFLLSFSDPPDVAATPAEVAAIVASFRLG